MSSQEAHKTRLIATFKHLERTGAGSFPAPLSLSSALEKIIPVQKGRGNQSYSFNVPPATAGLFCTAAIEMWFKSLNSFLVSASLVEISPVWSSVAGYYSSHYSVRALAHLLGYFHLHNRRLVARLELNSGKYICSFETKGGNDREHSAYWRFVKNSAAFAANPLFTLNISSEISDVSHRDRANYADHLGSTPQIRVLSIDVIRTRIEKISQIEITEPPIPHRDKFPDLDAVHILAYHRIAIFREYLDEVLGPSHRYWGVQRDPPWARALVDYQRTPIAHLVAPN